MKDLEKMVKDLDEEISRTKDFLNNNGYHHGTSIWAIVNRYRKELKELKSTIAEDIRHDGIKNYGEVEAKFDAAVAVEMDEEIKHFKIKLAKASDQSTKDKLSKQIAALEEDRNAYHLAHLTKGNG